MVSTKLLLQVGAIIYLFIFCHSNTNIYNCSILVIFQIDVATLLQYWNSMNIYIVILLYLKLRHKKVEVYHQRNHKRITFYKSGFSLIVHYYYFMTTTATIISIVVTIINKFNNHLIFILKKTNLKNILRNNLNC